MIDRQASEASLELLPISDELARVSDGRLHGDLADGRTEPSKALRFVGRRVDEDPIKPTVESVDVAHGTIALLGASVSASGLASADGITTRLEDLQPGMKVRARGRCGSKTFVANAVSVVPPSPIPVEEIQGPIERVHPVIGTLQVAGITIVTDAETKIDRMDAR